MHRVITFLLVCGLCNSACTTMKPVRVAAPDATPFAGLKPGDTVLVYSKAGLMDRFVVRAVDAEHVVSATGTEYHKDDVVKLERKAVSWPKTIGLVAGIYLGAAAAIGVLFAIAFD